MPDDQERGLDQMYDDEVNAEQAARTLSDALLPTGWYRTKPALFVQGSEAIVEGFDSTQQPVTAPRRVFRFFGEVLQRPKAGQEGEGVVAKAGRIGFGMSPDRRNRPSESGGGPDSLSMLWAQAVTAFTTVYGRKPEKTGEVVKFVRDYAQDLRIIQIGIPTENNPEPRGEPRNMVVAFAPARD